MFSQLRRRCIAGIFVPLDAQNTMRTGIRSSSPGGGPVERPSPFYDEWIGLTAIGAPLIVMIGILSVKKYGGGREEPCRKTF